MALQRNKSGPSRLLSSRNHGCVEYDVFLSFCGEDTGHFTGFFHHMLELNGIRAFFDEEDLPKWKRIEEILEAIRRSRILVPIFSQRYAASKWCLGEVAEMVACEDGGQERVIIPIFFDVDPRDVRHQTGLFEAAFNEHLQKEKRDEVDGWRRALQYVGEISGYHLKDCKGNQVDIVASIVGQIQKVVATRFEYDVFLSFHGNDTRENFTRFFHYILELKGIHTFFDEKDLRKGKKIKELLKAITKSKILVPIFSQHYAESTWCLREVAKMVECDDGGQERLIIPIFFDVDPTDVQHQTGLFEAAFMKHQKKNRDEVDEWRKALGYVGGIPGYHLKDYYKGNRRQLVDSISEEIQKVLITKRLLHEEEYLVGVDVRVDEVNKRLDFEAEGARIIGIHGIGGIGKTTLAKAIYNRNRDRFQASCFIENVREVSRSSKGGLIRLQQQLIQDILKDKHEKRIFNSRQGAKMIKDMLRGKRVLLVLDDVDDKKQLNRLAGNISRSHSGSRVIVTTRQKKILEGLKDEAVYSLEELEEKEALQLFNHHAFGADGPQEKYINLIEEVVSISKRVPLALQVFGAVFRTAGTREEWEELVEELRRRQPREVHEKLRISYDSLNDQEKLIFLDIACLLVGKNSEDAIYVWEDLKLSPQLTLLSLQNKSLVKINKGKFEMHDQIRDMGREVVLRESRQRPEDLSRLWHRRDIKEALTKSQGNKIECIILNVHEGSETKLSTQAFELLSKLRILHINYAISGGCDFKHFPASLKWLEWKGCPLETLPLESKFKSIVVLNLSRSSISQLWGETTTGWSSKSVKELFYKLKVLDLSSCHCLIATPNFAMAPNLEKLILDQCITLKEVDDSIGYLKKLVFLSMRQCVSLEKLPNKIYELSSLQVFDLERCRGLVAFPQILEDSNSIIELTPDRTVLAFLPTSTSRILYLNQTPHIDLYNPEGLILRDCKSLKCLPDHPHRFLSLKSLHIDDCLQDMAFRVWDIEAAYISGSPILPQKQESSFVLPVGSISDPLLLQQLRCYGYGDPCLNGTMVLSLHYKELTNERWITLDTHEAHYEDSNSKDDVYGHCYTINFGSSDKINEVPRGKTTIMKVTTSNNCKLTKVDVKLQKRSKFSGENMKPFISISRGKAFTGPPPSLPPSPSRTSEVQFSIFFNLSKEEVNLDVIEYSTGIHNCIDQITKKLNVQFDESMLLFGWTIKELIIIFILILSDRNVFWYEPGHGAGLPRLARLEVFDKIKSLDLSYCKFLVKTHDFVWSPCLEILVLDHCEELLEIDESIGQLKYLIRLSTVGCTNLRALPYNILQLNSLQVLDIKKCQKIKMFPEASMMDVRLDALEMLILDGCTSLTRVPEFIGGFMRLYYLSLRSCRLLKQLPASIGRLEALEVLMLDDCTSLTEFPDYVAQFKSLRHLSMKGCSSLKKLPDCIGSLEVLEVLRLDGCTSLTEFPENVAQIRSLRSLSSTKIPKHVGRLKSLRSLSFRGCRLIKYLPDAIGSLVMLKELLFDCFPSLERLPDSIGNLKSLTTMRCIECPRLTSMPDLSSLTSLEELNVAGCSSLCFIPSLEKLISLKALHVCGCRCLDLDWIQLQLQVAEFHDLEAFDISASTCRMDYVGIPFPIGWRTSSKPLLVEKIDLHGRTNIDGPRFHGRVRCKIKVAVAEDKAKCGDGQVLPSEPVKDGLPYYIDAFVDGAEPTPDYFVYSARIGEDDEINKRLMLLASTSSDHGSRVGTLNVSYSEGNFSVASFDVHMVSPNSRSRSEGLT